jgi:hypothetical protein
VHELVAGIPLHAATHLSITACVRSDYVNYLVRDQHAHLHVKAADSAISQRINRKMVRTALKIMLACCNLCCRWNRIFSQAPAEMDMAEQEYRVQNSGESARLDFHDSTSAAGRVLSATNMLRQRSITQMNGNNTNSNADRSRMGFLHKGRASFIERGMDLAGVIANKLWRQQSSTDGMHDSNRRAAGGSFDTSSVHSSCMVTTGGDTLLLFASPEGGASVGIGRSSAEAAANAAGGASVNKALVPVDNAGHFTKQPPHDASALGYPAAGDAAEDAAAAAAAAAAVPDTVDAVSAAASSSFSIGANQVNLQGLQDNLLRPPSSVTAGQRQKRPNVGVGGISFAISTAAGAGAGEGARPGSFTAALQQEHAVAGSGGYSLAGMLKRRSSLTNRQALKLGEHNHIHHGVLLVAIAAVLLGALVQC